MTSIEEELSKPTEILPEIRKPLIYNIMKDKMK